MASRPPRHHQVPGGGNSSSSNNPTGLSLGLEQGFESHHHRYSGAGDHRDVVVVTVSEGEEQGAEDDPPPPYSPGLRNFFSLTRRQERMAAFLQDGFIILAIFFPQHLQLLMLHLHIIHSLDRSWEHTDTQAAVFPS